MNKVQIISDKNKKTQKIKLQILKLIDKAKYKNLNMKMFNRTGYFHVKNFFDPKKISYEADKTIEISQKKKWKYIKVYHNIYIFNLINIFMVSIQEIMDS